MGENDLSELNEHLMSKLCALSETSVCTEMLSSISGSQGALMHLQSSDSNFVDGRAAILL